MDEKTRGFIEKGIDETMKKDILARISWVEKEMPISSMRDVIIGYLVGVLQAFCEASLMVARIKITPREMQEIATIIKRRLPQIAEKIERELNI